ncbi:MAG TPA: hypothetical protein VI790_02335 [Candidatus Nanoarchaeia archaeon]|nr:hypothetical protein [Candidatus Nanoarchaeia archaeon]
MVTADSDYKKIELAPVVKPKQVVVDGSIADLIIDYNINSLKSCIDVGYTKRMTTSVKSEINELLKFYDNQFKSNATYEIIRSLESINRALHAFDMDKNLSSLSLTLCNRYLNRYQKEYHPLYNRIPKRVIKTKRQ